MAYEKLSPDAGLHAHMVDAAQRWRQAAGDVVTRMNLRRWIEEEQYDCDPPTAFEPKVRKTKPKADTTPALTAEERLQAWAGEVSFFTPRGTFDAEIDAAVVENPNPAETVVVVNFKIQREGERGAYRSDVEQKIYVEHAEAEVQWRGRQLWRELLDAIGKDADVEDAEEVMFWPLRLKVAENGMVSYLPPASSIRAAA
ncbi:hypothetical protein ABLE91_24295 [Aquabacter sp. CN5-332]|uniref:hypothetical protein n=1 Tax=Aquabacter sp. CN5-332 TaxID=3156608 RepID=UPI0032B5E67C